MADYIDREKLLKSIPSVKDDKTISLFGAVADMICIVNSVPKEDVALVVHARWIWNPNGMDHGLGAWQCGRCFTRNNSLPMNSKMNPLMFIGSKYCPECGAKMDAK